MDPATGIAYQNRGSYFSLDPDHPNVLAPGKRTLHTLLPGMLFRDGRPWVVHGSMGGDAQPAIFAQVVSALVDGGVDVATAVAAPRWSPAPAAHFAPPDARARSSRASGPGCSTSSPRWGTASTSASRSTAAWATPTRSSSSTAGRPAAARSRRPPTRARPGLPAAW